MISAILVNYHTDAQILAAVSSLLTQHNIPKLEIIVVDNSSFNLPHNPLKESLPDAITYISNRENKGFAHACNQAFACASGEFILLLNPDARLLPGALTQLFDCLIKHPDAGAVGPRTYWDDDCRFFMPPSTFPSIINQYKETIGRLHWRLADYYSRNFRKKALKIWTCTAPMTVEALSGGHVLLRRQAIDHCGGLFDERFFMYWEDSDLMARLKKNGYHLYMEPQAGCLHEYEHSQAKNRLIAQGWPIYRKKNLEHSQFFQFTNWLNQRIRPLTTPTIESLSILDGKLTIPVPTTLQNAWLLELGNTPQMVPAIGHFGSGPTAEIDAHLFKRLQDNIYYARLSAPKPNPDLLYYWQWRGYSPKTD